MILTKKELAQKLMAGEKLTCDSGNTYCIYDEENTVPFRTIEPESKENWIMNNAWVEEEWEIYKEPFEVWKPKDGDVIYTIITDGSIYKFQYEDVWLEAYNQGILFQTREKALKEIQLRKATFALKQEIERLNEGLIPNWDSDEVKYFVYFVNGCLFATDITSIKFNQDWFYLKSEKLAEEIIETHEKELRIYYGADDV